MVRLTAIMIALLIGVAATGAAQPEQNYPVSELYVLSADGARIDGDRLTLSGVDATVIWFTDRPAHQAGRADTQVFIANWPMGEDGFAVDPPNAVLVGGTASGEVEVALELFDPEWAGQDLVLRVKPLEAASPHRLSLSAVHLFIDNQPDPQKGPENTWCGHECFIVFWPRDR